MQFAGRMHAPHGAAEWAGRRRRPPTTGTVGAPRPTSPRPAHAPASECLPVGHGPGAGWGVRPSYPTYTRRARHGMDTGRDSQVHYHHLFASTGTFLFGMTTASVREAGPLLIGHLCAEAQRSVVPLRADGEG